MVLCPFNKWQKHRGVKNLTRSHISNGGTPVCLILEPDLLTTQFSQDASNEFGRGKKQIRSIISVVVWVIYDEILSSEEF